MRPQCSNRISISVRRCIITAKVPLRVCVATTNFCIGGPICANASGEKRAVRTSPTIGGYRERKYEEWKKMGDKIWRNKRTHFPQRSVVVFKRKSFSDKRSQRGWVGMTMCSDWMRYGRSTHVLIYTFLLRPSPRVRWQHQVGFRIKRGELWYFRTSGPIVIFLEDYGGFRLLSSFNAESHATMSRPTCSNSTALYFKPLPLPIPLSRRMPAPVPR